MRGERQLEIAISILIGTSIFACTSKDSDSRPDETPTVLAVPVSGGQPYAGSELQTKITSEALSPFAIVQTAPADGDASVPDDKIIVIVFSAVPSWDTVNAETISLEESGGVKFPIAVYPVGRAAAAVTSTFALRFDATYAIRIKGGENGVASANGETLPEDFVVHFATGEDLSNTTFSYYSPGFGTVHESFGRPASAPKLVGAPLGKPLAILSDLGTNVTILEADGTRRCMANLYPDVPKTLTLAEGLLVTVASDKIIFVDPTDCAISKTLQPYPGHFLSFANPVAEGYVVGLNEPRSIGNVRIWSPELGTIWTDPVASSWPRHATLQGTEVVVSDTFAHCVYGVERGGSEQSWGIMSFSPTLMQESRDGAGDLLLLEEHLNRVVRLDHTTHARTVIVACNHPLYQDGETSRDLILDEVASTSSGWPADYPKSVCAREIGGPRTLYSPNGFLQPDVGGLIVADTDNHRVVVFDRFGRVVTEIFGFNNPAGVVELPD